MLFGILGVHKPAGMSSFDVIRVIKQKTGLKKMGHGGTLDPLAEGVLPILVGEASSFFDAILQSPKTYEAAIRLGSFTETDDAEGEVTQSLPVPQLSPDDVRAVLPVLSGEILQTPPKYSALRVGGRRAYELAREGAEVVLLPRSVHIHSWENLTVEEGCIRASITCSSGTYIRSLARSLGELLHTGAHLEGLKRTRCGGLGLAQCVELKKLGEGWQEHLAPLEKVLDYMPQFVWKGSLSWLLDGKPLSDGRWDIVAGSVGASDLHTLVFEGRILGLVRVKDGKVAYQRNLARLYDEI